MSDFWRPDFFQQLLVFLALTFSGVSLGALISIPLGIVLARVPWFATPTLSVLGLVQTIPSLALLAFGLSFFVGPTVAVVAAIVYSIFPMVLNTYTGLRQVDPVVLDAARGMGMTGRQVLRRIELPLSLPVILTGVRTAAVYVIGVVTLCAMVGAGGLGQYVITGMVRGDLALSLLGILPILAITFCLFLFLSRLGAWAKERNHSALKRSFGALGLIAVLALAVTFEQIAAEFQSRAASGSAGSGSLLDAWRNTPGFWDQAWKFASLTARGIGIALLVGIPVGIVLTRRKAFAEPVMRFLGLVQTTPSLALLGVCVSLFGLFGPSAAIFATVVYSLFPIIVNTYVGITQVDPDVRDAARGMGMTDRQILWRIELRLALPTVMAGVRTAAVYAIGMVTVCSLVGARGLGDYILDGMTRNDDGLILLGVIPILVFSFGFLWLLSAVTHLVKIRGTVGAILSVTIILLLSGYALLEPVFRQRADVLIGSKNFTEGRILAEIMKQMIEHSPETRDLSVEMVPNLGSSFVYKSLRAGVIDAYPEYTGTLLTAEDGLAEPVPEDKSKITEYVREEMKDRFHLLLLDRFGLNNTYGVIVPHELARKEKLRTISDLKRMPDLRVIVDQEFLERSDGWKGLTEKYKLEFNQPPRQFASNLIYRSLLAGNADVVIGYTTDWQINRHRLVVLEDDKEYFPSYHGAPLVREDLLDRHPEVGVVLKRLRGKISDATIQRMNYQVAEGERTAAEVAHDFLVREGLIPNVE